VVSLVKPRRSRRRDDEVNRADKQAGETMGAGLSRNLPVERSLIQFAISSTTVRIRGELLENVVGGILPGRFASACRKELEGRRSKARGRHLL
jgi:hypothetical protein